MVALRSLVLAATAVVAPALASDWTGSINLNASIMSSNRDSQSFLVLADTSRSQGSGTLGIKLLYAFGRKEDDLGANQTTEDRASLSGRYDLSLGPRSFYFFGQRFDRDRIASLDLRSLTSAGLGLVLVQSEAVGKTGKFENEGDREWRVSAGFAYRTEEYSDDLGSTHDVGLDLGSTYRHRLTGPLFLRHSLAFVPAFNDFGNYFLASDLGLDFALASNLKVGLGWLLDYNSQPAPGTRKDTSLYALTVGFKF